MAAVRWAALTILLAVFPPATLHSQEIRDPLYEFLITIAERDSLGTWNADDLREIIASSSRQSLLPCERITKIVRRPAQPDEQDDRSGFRVARMWEIELHSPVSMPMPYSFLGYHPGTLSATQKFLASEWRLGRQTLYIAKGNDIERHAVDNVLVFRIDQGSFVLDVDAWVDRLLGGRLDDFAVDGFAVCRDQSRIRTVSLLTTRTGRRDFGEFDLAHDQSIGEPDRSGLALAFLTRPWTLRSRPLTAGEHQATH